LKNKKHIRIREIIPGSIADEAGIEAGDFLLSINGRPVKDVFDYRFMISEEEITVEIQKPDGEIWEIEIEKDQYEDLGIEFEDPLMDEIRSCSNKCIFCFIDQLPGGMRETLYFKDDDSRMSFLSGNYVTLTNMKDDDINRIIKYKMSPINISVHTTNPELRIKMLGNRFAGNILEKIRLFVGAGITVNTQIVLCNGINDGPELDRTIADLSQLYPGVMSTSVVPVGLTRHRQNLQYLKPHDKHTSLKVIEQVEAWQKKNLAEIGSRAVFLADEFYIMAEKELPLYHEYEGFPQIENGVGMVTSFRYEFFERLKEEEEREKQGKILRLPERRHVSVATGVSVYKYIKEMAEILEKKYNGLKVDVYPVVNDFFGERITVTGLLTGRDIVNQLKGKIKTTGLLISRSMLKSDEDVFLDDYTVEMVEKRLGTSITVVDNDGSDFFEKILGTGV